MKLGLLLTLTLVVLSSSRVTRAQEKGSDRLAPLARFAGAWTLDAKWADGTPLRARAVYEWGLGGKIMRARTFIINGTDERQRYEDVIAWDPRRESIVDVSFSVDGAINEMLVESKDEHTLLFGWKPYHEGKPGRVRQTITFDDKDRFVWIVELNTEGEWKQIMEGTWVRAKTDEKR